MSDWFWRAFAVCFAAVASCAATAQTVIDFEDAWADSVFFGPALESYYGAEGLEMVFGPDATLRYPGLIGGVGNGDPGGFRLEGTAGSTSVGVNFSTLSISLIFTDGPQRVSVDIGTNGGGTTRQIRVIGTRGNEVVVDDTVSLTVATTDPDGGWVTRSYFDVERLDFSIAAGGTVFALDNLRFGPVSAVTHLGRVGPSDTPVVFETLTSGFDTEIAVWDSSGDLIATNDDFGGVEQSVLQLNLSEGDYVAGVSGSLSAFVDGFGVTGPRIIQSGVVAGSIGGVAFPGMLTDSVDARAAYVTFSVDNTADARIAQGLGASFLDLGTLASPFRDFELSLSGTAGDLKYGVYEAVTGRLFSRRLSGTGLLSLPAGEYVMVAIAGPGDFAYGFTAPASSNDGTLRLSVDGSVRFTNTISAGEKRFFSFRVVDPGAAADIDGNGTVDVFDLIAFLQAFSAALN